MNAYVDFKRVERRPANLIELRTSVTASGQQYQLLVSDDENPCPALYVALGTIDGPVALRVDVDRLVACLAGGLAAELDQWSPLALSSGYELDAELTLWGNEQLTVARTWGQRDDEGRPVSAYLNYHRRDRAPIRDWRIGQRLKNELCGDEWEAIELYPAESRLIDDANEYHLYAYAERLPFGDHSGRSVSTQADGDAVLGGAHAAVQRDPVTA